MRAVWNVLVCTACASAALSLAGCSGDDPNRQTASGVSGDARRVAASESPASQPVEPPPERDPILPESREWPRELALEKLADSAAQVSAAVRLVRLSETTVHCVPDPLPARLASRLAVEKVGETTWAIGIRDRRQHNLLRSPALIDEEGEVRPLAEGAEEEVSTLRLSAEPVRFPHVLLTPRRVVVVGDEPQVALQLRAQPPGLRFEVREIGNVNYVLLMLSHGAIAAAAPDARAEPGMRVPEDRAAGAPQSAPAGAPVSAPASAALVEGDAHQEKVAAGGSPPAERYRDETGVEVARYRWDVYEMSFAGPAADKLPDPPGGRFEMDLAASEALLPVGGELPPAMKNTEPPIPASRPGRPPF